MSASRPELRAKNTLFGRRQAREDVLKTAMTAALGPAEKKQQWSVSRNFDLEAQSYGGGTGPGVHRGRRAVTA